MATHITSWKRLKNSTGPLPRPRHGHRAVSVKDLMIVFGGGNEGIMDTIHVYQTSSNQWFIPKVHGDVPPGCAAFGFAIDVARLLVFGGMLEFGVYSNKLYELDATCWVWKRLNPRPPVIGPLPCPRIGHSFTRINKKVYLFGGISNDVNVDYYSTNYLNDVYVLNLYPDRSTAWEIPQVYGPSPPPRESHSACAHTSANSKSKLIIFGGMDGSRLGDLWILDIDSMTWTQPMTLGKTPLPRSLHTATIIDNRMFVFGGWVPAFSEDDEDTNTDNESCSVFRGKEWKCSNDLSCFNVESMRWEELILTGEENNKPSARAGHSAIEVRGKVYFWSGRDGYRKMWNNQICLKDLWCLEMKESGSIEEADVISASINSINGTGSLFETISNANNNDTINIPKVMTSVPSIINSNPILSTTAVSSPLTYTSNCLTTNNNDSNLEMVPDNSVVSAEMVSSIIEPSSPVETSSTVRSFPTTVSSIPSIVDKSSEDLTSSFLVLNHSSALPNNVVVPVPVLQKTNTAASQPRLQQSFCSIGQGIVSNVDTNTKSLPLLTTSMLPKSHVNIVEVEPEKSETSKTPGLKEWQTKKLVLNSSGSVATNSNGNNNSNVNVIKAIITSRGQNFINKKDIILQLKKPDDINKIKIIQTNPNSNNQMNLIQAKPSSSSSSPSSILSSCKNNTQGAKIFRLITLQENGSAQKVIPNVKGTAVGNIKLPYKPVILNNLGKQPIIIKKPTAYQHVTKGAPVTIQNELGTAVMQTSQFAQNSQLINDILKGLNTKKDNIVTSSSPSTTLNNNTTRKSTTLVLGKPNNDGKLVKDAPVLTTLKTFSTDKRKLDVKTISRTVLFNLITKSTSGSQISFPLNAKVTNPPVCTSKDKIVSVSIDKSFEYKMVTDASSIDDCPSTSSGENSGVTSSQNIVIKELNNIKPDTELVDQSNVLESFENNSCEKSEKTKDGDNKCDSATVCVLVKNSNEEIHNENVVSDISDLKVQHDSEINTDLDRENLCESSGNYSFNELTNVKSKVTVLCNVENAFTLLKNDSSQQFDLVKSNNGLPSDKNIKSQKLCEKLDLNIKKNGISDEQFNYNSKQLDDNSDINQNIIDESSNCKISSILSCKTVNAKQSTIDQDVIRLERTLNGEDNDDESDQGNKTNRATTNKITVDDDQAEEELRADLLPNKMDVVTIKIDKGNENSTIIICKSTATTSTNSDINSKSLKRQCIEVDGCNSQKKGKTDCDG